MNGYNKLIFLRHAVRAMIIRLEKEPHKVGAQEKVLKEYYQSWGVSVGHIEPGDMGDTLTHILEDIQSIAKEYIPGLKINWVDDLWIGESR